MIDQQSKEGGWGRRKVSRGRYVLSDDDPESIEGTIDETYETELKKRLEITKDFEERAKLLCVLVEMELDRLRPKGKEPEFKNEDRELNMKKLIGFYQIVIRLNLSVVRN